MEIGPLQKDSPAPAAVSSRGTPSQSIPAGGPRLDSLEISAATRGRLARLADDVRVKYGIDETPPEARTTDRDIRWDRVRLAQARIRSGFYSQPHVKAEIADRLADDMKQQDSDCD